MTPQVTTLENLLVFIRTFDYQFIDFAWFWNTAMPQNIAMSCTGWVTVLDTIVSSASEYAQKMDATAPDERDDNYQWYVDACHDIAEFIAEAMKMRETAARFASPVR